MTPELAEITARIEHIIPEEIRSVHEYPNAEQFVVVEVNSEWIFRFLRDADDPCLEYEKQFLPLFAQMSPLPIPAILCSGQDFIAYRRIQGERLSLVDLDALAADSRIKMARQLGEFLTVLHSFPVNRAEKIGLSDSWGGWREQAHEIFRCEVAPLLTAETRRGALALLDLYSGLHTRVVIHGDFTPYNILVVAEEERVSGVIDFGHVTIEDDARDFTDIARALGPASLMEVISHYDTDDAEALHSRVLTRQKEGVLGDAVFSFQTGQVERLQRRVAEMDLIFGST